MDLHSLVDGLLYPSEDDRPFDVIDWPPDYRMAAHMPDGATGSTLTMAEFFHPLRSATDADRFAALERMMTECLSDLLVVRVDDGTAEVQVFVVGRTSDGRWRGVRTVSVET